MLPRKFYLDHFFDDFFDQKDTPMMKCDVYEKDGLIHIEADIPGFDRNDISVECNNGYLTISAKKETNDKEENKEYIRQERFYGQLQRRFYIGEVEEDKIDASFKDGVLKISVPKEPKEQPKKQIEIK